MTRFFVVLALVAAAACSKNTPSASAPSSTPPATSESASPTTSAMGLTSPFNDGGTADVSSATTFNMTTTNFVFTPSILRGKPGQKLTIMITNTTSTPHNFTLEEQKINKDLAGHGKATVSVTFPATGQLEFHCEYHVGKGMKGALTV